MITKIMYPLVTEYVHACLEKSPMGSLPGARFIVLRKPHWHFAVGRIEPNFKDSSVKDLYVRGMGWVRHVPSNDRAFVEFAIMGKHSADIMEAL